MDVERESTPTLEDLYTPIAAERLNILRRQIEIAQGRKDAETAA